MLYRLACELQQVFFAFGRQHTHNASPKKSGRPAHDRRMMKSNEF